MDIMLPPLHDQVSPAPWLERKEEIDLPAVIRDILHHRPQASLEDLVAELHARHIDVDGAAVATWLERCGDLSAAIDDR
jgi:hypothetical protein